MAGGALLLLAVLVTFAQAPLLVGSLMQTRGGDFGTFYRSTSGGALYEAADLNPPHFHLLLLPLARLSWWDALRVWEMVSAAALLVVLRRWIYPWPWWAPAALLAWAPTNALLGTGQVAAVLLVPLALSWHADRHGRSSSAGAWLGPALVTKPILAILLVYWLLHRRWRALWACALTGALTVLTGIAVYGVAAYAEWFTHLGEMARHWHVMNASLWGPLARVCGPSAGTYTAFAACAPGVGWAFLAGLAGVLAVTTWALARSSDADRGWAIALTAMLLLSPIGWVYYTWWVVLPLWHARLPRWSGAAGLLALLVPPWALWRISESSPWLALTVGSLYTYGLLTWWVGLTGRELASIRPGRVGVPASQPAARLYGVTSPVTAAGLAGKSMSSGRFS